MAAKRLQSGPAAVIVGVGYGTLPGHALARFADGEELGRAVRPSLSAVVEHTPAGTDPRLPSSWTRQIPWNDRDVRRHALPQALKRPTALRHQVLAEQIAGKP